MCPRSIVRGLREGFFLLQSWHYYGSCVFLVRDQQMFLLPAPWVYPRWKFRRIGTRRRPHRTKIRLSASHHQGHQPISLTRAEERNARPTFMGQLDFVLRILTSFISRSHVSSVVAVGCVGGAASNSLQAGARKLFRSVARNPCYSSDSENDAVRNIE